MLKKVKIGGHWIKVKRSKGHINFGKGKLLGLADFTFRDITVAKSYRGRKIPKPHQKQVLLHEIIHHVDNIYSSDMTEQQISQLSEGMYQVLHDNKLKF